MRSRFILMGAIALAMILAGAPLGAQQENLAKAQGPTVLRVLQHDVSPPLSEIAIRVSPPQGLNKEVGLGVPHSRPGRPADVPGQPDPLRQTDEFPVPGAGPTPAPTLNFPGLSDDLNSAVVGTRIVPPDTEGDVGLNYYVQWINLIFAVYDKSTGAIAPGGGPFAGNSIWNGFGGACQTTNNGDPVVLFDHLANRWLLTQFAINQGIECMALSQTSDPRGPYDRWALVVSPGEQNDYPKIGLMPDAYYMSTRDFPSNDGTFAGFVAVDRAAMLAGNPNPTVIKFNLPCGNPDCPDGVQPPHLEGPAPAAGTPGIFTRFWDDQFEGTGFGSDGIRLWELDPNFANPGASTFTELPYVTGTNYDSTMCGFFQRSCVPQPSPGEGLDPADELQMYRSQYRHWGTHDSIVLAITVDATGSNVAGMRWAELRNSGGGWSLYQEGTYAPADGLNRWMGSIAMNDDGAIALGYNVSSSAVRPSIRYVTRCPSDPLGTMPGGEVEIIAGTGVQQSSSNRWGDYSAMSVDPVDGTSFWYTGEYYETSGSFDFNTRIATFPGPNCGPACTDDVDLDGFIADTCGGNDCNDNNAAINPAATEVCNDGVDNNCNGLTDCADPACGGDPACPFCGDNTIDPGELCDGTDLGGQTCVSQGFPAGGTLACNGTCDAFDTSGCLCAAKGASCVNDSDCCSNKCKGPTGGKTCK